MASEARASHDRSDATAPLRAPSHRLPASGGVLGGRRPTARHHGSDEDPTVELGPGAQMLGPYLLVDKVGQGGMGVVHKAVNRDGQEVAVKVLRPHIADDDGARDRLRREVSTLARIRHDAVAPVLDADIDGVRPYLVTSFVPGPPLDDVVDEHGPLSPEQLVSLGRGLAEALRAIHAAGVVHRDLKPGNVLMVGDDPVVIDFGIAHAADDIRLTMTGLVMGTPGYLSPEVVEGAPVSESTDWWGWAATLAFAASGHAPFGKGPMPVVLDRVTRGQADLSGVDERLRPLLQRALSPVPADRPSADDVLAELERYAAGGHTTGIPVASSAGYAGFADHAVGDGRPATQHTPVVPRTQVQPVRRPDPTSAMPVARAAAPAPAAHSHNPYASPASVGPMTPSSVTSPERAPSPQPTAQADRWRAPSATPGPVPAQQWSGPRPDPRIGMQARSRSLMGLLVALVALTSLWPAVGLTLLLVWTVAARWVDRSMTAMVLRRFQQGARRSDGVMAVVSSPWHGVRAVLASVFALLLPAFLGGVAAVTTALVVSISTGDSPQLESSLPWAVGILVAAWVLWWGPGGPSMRRGSRSIVRGLLRTAPVTQVVMVLCGVLTAWCFWWALSHGMDVSWWPFNPGSSWSINDWIPQLPG